MFKILFGNPHQDQCPACSKPLVAFELEGVELDGCPGQCGTWLDAGELVAIGDLTEMDTEPLRAAVWETKATGAGERHCPRCGKKLELVPVGGEGDTAIEVDRCPKGHGLWLDRGEIVALVDLFAGTKRGDVAAFFQDFFRFELEQERKGDS